MTDGWLWHTLVARRRWSDERYAAWLGSAWVGMLVGRTDRQEGADLPAS